MAYTLSASIEIKEKDLSIILPAIAGTPAAIVMETSKGPIVKTRVSSQAEYITTFGTPTNSANFSALAYLAAGNELWVLRVTKDALYGGVEFGTQGTAETNHAFVSGNADPSAYDFSTGLLIACTNSPNEEKIAVKLEWEKNLFGRGTASVNVYTLPDLPDGWTSYSGCTILESGNVVDTGDYSVNDSTGEISFNSTPTVGASLQATFDVFYITPYSKSGINNYEALESPWRVSRRRDAKDARNNSIYVETVINTFSTYIKAYDNTSADETLIPKEQATFLDFYGGSNGDAITNSEIVLGWSEFSNPEDTDVRMLINGGYCSATDTSVQLKMISIAEQRKDCLAILDVPLKPNGDSMTADEMADYSLITLANNSKYAALYGDWVKIYNEYTNSDIWCPVSGFVAGAVASTESSNDIWWAPAGWIRGKLNVKEVKTIFDLADRDVLAKANINPIRFKRGLGISIWGEKTLYGKGSAFDSVHVRFLFIVIEKALATYLENVEFDFNDSTKRLSIQNDIDKYLTGILTRRGLTGKTVVCNDTNNTPTTIDQGILNVDVYLQPVRVIEKIVLNMVATKTGVSFSEGVA